MAAPKKRVSKSKTKTRKMAWKKKAKIQANKIFSKLSKI